MSQSEEINRREVAYRLFAAEFEDADFSYAESDEERAPNYVVTPTGARVNRLFVVGVLTEVEQVNEDVVRARVVDPTGAFVVYAGQYQPEALAALERAETPSFVAVTGKARTFQPDDSDVVYTSIRPEHVSEVDAATRDRWVVSTAEQTTDRVATMAAAHDRVERGDNLRSVLEAAGVRDGLAAGIPLALDHYDTSPAYLQAVYDLALDAARVVAGDQDEVGDLSLAPDEGDGADLSFAASLAVAEADVEAGTETEPTAEEDTAEPADDESETAAASSEATDQGPAAETPEPDEVAAEAEPESGDAGTETADADVDAESEADEEASDAGAEVAETAGETSETGAEATDVAEEASDAGEEAAETAETAADDGEMYELSEEEREEVKENFDVGFSSGSEIPEAGEANLDATEAEDESGAESADAADAVGETEAVGEVDGGESEDEDLGDFDAGDEDEDESGEVESEVEAADSVEEFTEEEYDEPASEMEDEEAASMELDLEDYVVDLMDELDDGDGARREEVVATATEEYDADEGEVEDAIQSALMSGRCYESGDDHLKAI